MDGKAFGNRLREALEKAGYNQTSATKELNLSKNAINNYVGGRIPESPILYDLSNLLGVSMEWLLTGEDVPIENLIFYKEAKSVEEFIQMVGRSSRFEAKKPPKTLEDENDIYDKHYVVEDESSLVHENENSYGDKTKSQEEDELIKAYRDLPEEDKLLVKNLIGFRYGQVKDALKKKGRSSIYSHGEEAATKMNA